MYCYYQLNYIPKSREQLNYNDDVILDDNVFHDEDVSRTQLIWRDLPTHLDENVAVVCRSGAMRLKANMEEVTVAAGDLLLMSRGVLIESFEATADYRGCWVSVIRLSGNVLSSNTILHALRRLLLAGPIVCHLAEREARALEDTYRLMRDVAGDDGYLYRSDTMGHLFTVFNATLLNVLRRQGRLTEPKMPTRQDEIFDQFVLDINKFFAEHRDLGFYADRQYLSTHYLARAVRAVSGRLPADWIRDTVILNAKVLVESGRYSMQDISKKLHFPNQSGFNMYFKAAVGCSPMQWLARKER